MYPFKLRNWLREWSPWKFRAYFTSLVPVDLVATVLELVVGDAGTGANEDEYEAGDKPGQTGLEGVRMSCLLGIFW